MTASLETLVVAAYIFADGASIPRPGPEGKITDAELIALAVAQAATGVPSDRQFLGLVGKLLPGWFPHLPCQSKYNRRLRRLAPSIASVQLRVSELLVSGDLLIADGTLVAVANYPRLREPQRVRGHRCLRLLRGKEAVRVGHAPGLADRRERSTGRLYPRCGQREGVRACV